MDIFSLKGREKIMKMSVLKRLFCGMLTCMMLFSGIGGVKAEETLLKGHVALFSKGEFPKNAGFAVKRRSISMVEDELLRQLKAQAQEIDVSEYQLSEEEFAFTYGKMLNMHPEMFFVNNSYGYRMNWPAATYVTEINPEYIYTGDELKRMQSIFDAGVNRVVSYARAASTDVGRLLRANDYLCANFEYDTSYTIYSPELFFEQGKGVCQAYTLAFRAVLNRLGITNICVSSIGLNHIWNMVYLDGSWYHIDVTWNDPTRDVPLRACHHNFLLSDAGITATGHYGWTDGPEEVYAANNQKYDGYFWEDILQVASMQGDVVYYVDSDYKTPNRNVYSHNLATGATTKIGSYDYGYGDYYINYNPVWVYDGMIHYAVRDKLYRMPLSGGEAEKVYSTGDRNQWIWYPYPSGSKLKMMVSTGPDRSGTIHSFDMKKACVEHVPVYEDGLEATCTEPGYTQMSYCEVCGETLTPREEIPPLGHSTVIAQGVDPSCTQSGMTEGEVCEVCGEVLKVQEEIPALGHDVGVWVIVNEATLEAEGLKEKRCPVCGYVLEVEILPKLEEEIRVSGDVSGDGVIDGRDLLRLAKYIGGHEVDINEKNASVNGDDVIDGRDLLRLAKFLGGFDVELK